MKVLMLLSKPFQPEPWIYREAKTLVDAGHHVKIIGWNRERKYKNAEILDGIEINRVSIRAPYGTFIGLLPLYPIFYLVIFFKSFFIDFDVIDCHNFDTLPLGLLIGKIRKKKVIYHCLDLYFTWFARETTSKCSRLLSKFFKKIEKIFLRWIDHLIVTAPGYIDYYNKYNIKYDSSILLNLPDKNFCKNIRNIRVKKDHSDFIISYIGEIRYEKPLINLINATVDIENITILIVGGGTKAENIKNMSKEHRHVKIVDKVPYHEVINYYKQSDCVYAVYDSKVENIKIAIPVKVFEAIACGIPVVVNNNVWISQFVKKNKIGFCVDEKNINEIRKVILKLKNDRNIRDEFMKNGIKLFENEYNWNSQEDLLLKIYKSL